MSLLASKDALTLQTIEASFPPINEDDSFTEERLTVIAQSMVDRLTSGSEINYVGIDNDAGIDGPLSESEPFAESDAR